MAEPNARSLDEIRRLLRDLEVSADDAWNVGSATGAEVVASGLPALAPSNVAPASERLHFDLPAASAPPATPAVELQPPLALPRIVEEQRKLVEAEAMRKPNAGTGPLRSDWTLFLASAVILVAASVLALVVYLEQPVGGPARPLVQGPTQVVRPVVAAAAYVPSEVPRAQPPVAEPEPAPRQQPAAARAPETRPALVREPAPEVTSPVEARPVPPSAPAAPADVAGAPEQVPAQARAMPAVDLAPRLVSPEEIAAPAGRRTRFTLAFEPASEAARHDVLLSGLEPSSRLDKGIELIQGTWLLRAADLGELFLRRAADAPERITLTLELRAQAGTVVGRSTLVLVASSTEPRSAEAELPATSTRVAEADLLLQEGRGLVARGDMANARLFLQQAAELGSAEAAFDLAETFDRRRTSSDVASAEPQDSAQALAWYERAAALGSEEARRRMGSRTRH